MTKRVRMLNNRALREEMGAKGGRKGLRKWVHGWLQLYWLHKALNTMPEPLWKVFGPVRYEDASYEELATRFGIDVQEVKQRMAWALFYLCRVSDGTPVWIVRRTIPVVEEDIAEWMEIEGPI